MESQSDPTSPSASALGTWYQDYLAEEPDSTGARSALLRGFEDDELDEAEIEEHIQRLVPTTDVDSEVGFCAKCRHLLDNWPDVPMLMMGPGGRLLATTTTVMSDWPNVPAITPMSEVRAVARPIHTYEIEAAARSGCKFCAFLLTQLKLEDKLDSFRKIERRLRLVNDGSTACLMIRKLNPGTWDLWIDYPVNIDPDNRRRAACFVAATVHNRGDRLPEEDLEPAEVARRWLATCQSSHEYCLTETQQQQDERPSRLIAIDHDTGKAKLVSTASMDSLPPYASLSYRWGTADFIRLTAANYDAFYSSIPLHLLPPTFQDAIHITKIFNLDHIWIDALCIVQDEPDNADWLREAGRMRSVYGFATITLAASWTDSVYDSLLPLGQGSPLTQKKKGRAGVSWKENSEGFCARVTHPYLDSMTRIQAFHTNFPYEESVTETPLARRAWALQEKLLAPRTLHLGSSNGPGKLFWECRSSVGSDHLPDGFPGRMRGYLVCNNGLGCGRWNWSELVEMYTATSLTVPGDKLPAMAGIARAQATAAAAATPGDNHHHQYLAGMWREELFRWLTWIVKQGETRGHRPKKWRAPTWSWAAVDGVIWFQPYLPPELLMGRVKELLRVVDVWTTLAGPDPFGAVTGGELTLGCEGMVRGRLVVGDGAFIAGESFLTRGYQNVYVDLSSGERLCFPVMLDCLGDDVRPKEALYLVPMYSRTWPLPRGVSGTKKEEKDKSQELEETEMKSVFGLVLQCCSGVGVRGRFRRVGAFGPGINSPHINREFLEVLQEVGASTAEAECARIDIPESGNPELRYIIIIE